LDSPVTPEDVVAEGVRLVELGRADGLPMRLLGGAAVRYHVGSMPPALARNIEDIDLITTRAAGRPVGNLLRKVGYQPSQQFNAVHGARRLLFMNSAGDRHLDVFVGSFQMCHALPIAERLEVEPVTVPLAELLMTKLQIVKLNQKDIQDMFALLLAHEVGTQDAETIHAGRIAQVAASDWGIFHTFELNLARLADAFAVAALSPPQQDLVARRLEALVERLRQEPKSMAWKIRARVGARMRWYEDPDEVALGARPEA
jgi:hypothetical protein